jgi:hypothetical protein
VGADPSGGALYPAEDVAVGGHILGDVADNPQRRQLYGNSLRDLQQREFSIQSMVGRTLAFYRTVT